MPEVFCPQCKAQREPKVHRRDETITVKGEPVEIQANVAVCAECGEDLFVAELEEHNVKRAFDIYRRRHDLLTASQIRELRERYGLSQRGLAQLLGWGEVTVSRYENGAIQTRGHDQFLRLLRDPENVRRLLDEGQFELPAHIADHLTERLAALQKAKAPDSLATCLQSALDSGSPGPLNGYRRFDLEKMHQASAYLASAVKHFFKTKATKLLWYADFLAFRSQASSITGCEYVAARFGPVPREFDLLFAEMVKSGVLSVVEIAFDAPNGNDVGGEMYTPTREPNLADFSAIEKRCLEVVAAEFGELTARQVVERAHREDAYKRVYEDGRQWKPIPYDLAATLSLPAVYK
ncbi:MAG: type II TA system antitoxin MqsA family protein [Candidatus Bipolaricaulota bacterium]